MHKDSFTHPKWRYSWAARGTWKVSFPLSPGSWIVQTSGPPKLSGEERLLFTTSLSVPSCVQLPIGSLIIPMNQLLVEGLLRGTSWLCKKILREPRLSLVLVILKPGSD